jgi:hypothetical protein
METASYNKSRETPSLYPELLFNLMLLIENIHIMKQKSMSRIVDGTVEVTTIRKVAVSIRNAPQPHLPRAGDGPIYHLTCFLYGTFFHFYNNAESLWRRWTGTGII